MPHRMARTRTHYLCETCGTTQPRWVGRCPDCGAWDALVEFRDPPAAAPTADGRAPAEPRPFADPGETEAAPDRLPTGIGELDRVFGAAGGTREAGVVPGSVVLVGGDPGVGKSTLLLQAAHGLAAGGARVLYASSEESAGQVRQRAERLEVPPAPEHLYLLSETELERVMEAARKTRAEVLVIDSIQMVHLAREGAGPSGVAQLRACCQALATLAKQEGIAVLVVGHVTKEGRLAGPRTLEHMVDAVIYLEGDRYHDHRVLRAIKNRFGTTLEVGLFEMGERGLAEVADGAAFARAEHTAVAGSVIAPVLQGSRCLLVEIQALTVTGFLGAAKRKTSGLSPARLSMLIAVLEKRGGLRLADQDVFVSSVGGLKIAEPAADLATCLAIAGVHQDKQLGATTCAIGEIGLSGEVRRVQGMPARIREACRLGFPRLLLPPGPETVPEGGERVPVRRLEEAMEQLG